MLMDILGSFETLKTFSGSALGSRGDDGEFIDLRKSTNWTAIETATNQTEEAFGEG